MNPQIRNPLQDKIDMARQAGYNDDEINSFLQVSSQPAPQQAAKPQKKKKSFWLDQISTAGGILGGIGGSFISPIAGTAAGAGAGSALGEALENLISGQKVTDNVVKEGALGAVFGAGPLKLLKGGAALATGKGVQAASKAALTPLRQTAGKALAGASDDLATKAFRLTPSQLTNYQRKFGEDASQVIKKYGFQNVDDVVTKGIQPLQQQFDDAIGAIPGVAKENLKKSFETRIKQLSSAGPSDSKAMGAQLKKEAEALLKGKGDVLDANELNVIRRQFDDLVNYTEKTANPSRYGVNKRMADALRETLQKAEPTGSLKEVGRELQKLRQLSDITAKQSNLGRGSLPLGLGNMLGAGVGGGVMGGPAGALGGFAATQLANSPLGRRTAMAGADKLGSALLASGAKTAGEQSLKGIAGRVGGAGVLGGVMNQVAQPQSLEDALMESQSLENSMDTNSMSPTSMNAPMNANMDTPYQNDGQESSPYTRDNLMADLKRDPKNAKDYLAYYQSLQEVFAPQESLQLSDSAIQNVNLLQSGLFDIDSLANTLTTTNKAGPIAGLQRLNPYDTEAKSVQADIDRVRQAVGKALEGGVLRKEDEVKYAKILPTISDTPTVASNKLRQLKIKLNQDLQNYVSLQQSFGKGRANTLSDALLMQQGAL